MDYFTRLAQQALGGQAAKAVQPRLPGRFEPGGVPQHAPAAPELRAEMAAAPDIAAEGPAISMHRGASAERTLAPLPRPPAEAAPGRTEAEPRQTEAARARTEAAPGRTEAARARTEAAPGRTEAAPGRTEAEPRQTEAAPAVAPASPSLALAARPGDGASAPQRALAVAPALAAPAPGGVRSQTDAAPPVIRVSIGRVEVRAVVRPAAPPPRPATARQPEAAPLENYLRAGKGGRPR